MCEGGGGGVGVAVGGGVGVGVGPGVEVGCGVLVGGGTGVTVGRAVAEGRAVAVGFAVGFATRPSLLSEPKSDIANAMTMATREMAPTAKMTRRVELFIQDSFWMWPDHSSPGLKGSTSAQGLSHTPGSASGYAQSAATFCHTTTREASLMSSSE